MFGFLKLFQQRREQTRTENLEAYRKLVRKAAERGDLPAGDAEKLRTAAEALGIPEDDAPDRRSLATDLAAVRQYVEAEALAAKLADLKQAARNAYNALNDYQTETARLAAERAAEARRLEKELGQARMAMNGASVASDTVKTLARKHFDLLGATNPADAPRVQPLYRDYPGQVIPDGAAVFERLMSEPFERFNAGPYVCPEGQNAAEFAEMETALKEAKGKRIYYLTSHKTERRPLVPHCTKNSAVFIEDAEAGSFCYPIGNAHFMPWPGTSERDFAALQERLRKAEEAATAPRQTGAPMLSGAAVNPW